MLLVVVGVLLYWGGGDVGAAVDSDGDGYDDALEAFLGTDPDDDCSVGADVGPSPAWPPDLDASTSLPNSIDTISFTDITRFVSPVARLGSRTGDVEYSERWDLNADGLIGTLDLAQLTAPMLGSTCPNPYVPPTPVGSIAEIAIDMDTTGNDARLTLGANVQNCGEINSGGTNTIEIDVLLPSPGVHASDGMEAWEFLLGYDPAVVSVTAEDPNFLLAQAAGSSLATGSDSLPDSGGSWRSSALDNTTPIDPEPTGTHEVGRGVLTRITLTGVAQGTSALTLTRVGAMTGANGDIPTVKSATGTTVSVDETCVPITPPTIADAMSIDMDPTGNSATTLGSREVCARINVNSVQDADEDAVDAVDFDFTITNVPPYIDNAPVGVVDSNDIGGTAGWAFELLYDEANLTVLSYDTDYLVRVNIESAVLDGTDDAPDTNGNDRFAAVIIDVGLGTPEDGSGVLTRLRIGADGGAATGVYALTMDPPGSAYFDSQLVDHFIVLEDGLIAIDEACPPAGADSDGDGVPDASDNCPSTPNPGQENDVHPGTPAGDHCEDPEPDGVFDINDNCPATANAGQEDNDGDLVGDVCDPDDDNDGVCDGAGSEPDGTPGTIAGGCSTGPDNCPVDYNPDQTDDDIDGEGNICDPDTDSDGDGVPNATDNCPAVFNPDQADADSDGAGDACDEDLDGDGVPNGADNCPDVANAGQTDTDGDGLGDACDSFPGDADSDDDLIADGAADPDGGGPIEAGPDNCPLTPNGPNEAAVPNVGNQTDTDGDGLGDACDPFPTVADGDYDGIPDPEDNCPSNYNAKQIDVDGDGEGDACDADIDGDGVANAADNCPRDANAGQSDGDADGLGDACDPNDASTDSDSDGIPDGIDPYPGDADGDGDGTDDPLDNCPVVPNVDQFDSDFDGLGDACDPNDGNPDIDGDGVDDGVDNCPLVANGAAEAGTVGNQVDVDGDGLGNVCDPNDADRDSDNDERIDPADNCRLAYNPFQSDLDGDGLGDACDVDPDGDGVNSAAPDNCLFVANAGQADQDSDGIGDACDPYPTSEDGDNDGIADPVDNCRTVFNPSQADSDKDRLGDACDPDPNDPDIDNDDVIDGLDNCLTTANTDQTNTDNDALGDACDPDDDDDGVCDGTGSEPNGTPGTVVGGCSAGPDNCPLVSNQGQADNDSDGAGDACDGDDDNDGLLDTVEDVCGSDKFDGASTPERVDGAFAGTDEDGNDGNDEALPPGSEVADCDGDGYTGAAEDHVYSYVSQLDGDQKTCQEYDTNFIVLDPNQTGATPSLRWPSDLRTGSVPNSTNRINILDMASIVAPVRYLGTNVGTNPGDVRFDISPGPGPLGTDINILDLAVMTAPASATGSPPMLGGARALNGPTCP